MIVKSVRQARNCDARILNDHLRNVDIDFVLDHENGRTARDRSLREPMPVDTLASDGNKKAAGHGGTRIDGDCRHRLR